MVKPWKIPSINGKNGWGSSILGHFQTNYGTYQEKYGGSNHSKRDDSPSHMGFQMI